MFYKYCMSRMSRASSLRDYGIIESDMNVLIFITTNGNIKGVKEAIRKSFAKKHGMPVFTEEAYKTALEANEFKFSDKRGFRYTFEDADESINELEPGNEMEERMYNIEEGKEKPNRWIGVFNENAFLYMPDGRYFKSKEDWNKCKEAVEKDPFSITHKISENNRPKEFYCPKKCSDFHKYRILDDKLKPIDNYECCDDLVYQLFNDK